MIDRKSETQYHPIKDKFEFGGYARSGTIFNLHGEGAGINPYITPASKTGGTLGRLGMESNTYVEASLKFNQVADNGTITKYQTMISQRTDSLNSNYNDYDSPLGFRRAFFDISNVQAFSKNSFLKDATFWVGKRNDRGNFNIGWTTSDQISLSVTGAGVQDVNMVEGMR